MFDGIYLGPHDYSTDKYNSNKDELEKIEMIFFDPIDVYFLTSKISINSPKIGQGLTQWALVPLGPTLIYNTKYRSSLM